MGSGDRQTNGPELAKSMSLCTCFVAEEWLLPVSRRKACISPALRLEVPDPLDLADQSARRHDHRHAPVRAPTTASGLATAARESARRTLRDGCSS